MTPTRPSKAAAGRQRLPVEDSRNPALRPKRDREQAWVRRRRAALHRGTTGGRRRSSGTGDRQRSGAGAARTAATPCRAAGQPRPCPLAQRRPATTESGSPGRPRSCRCACPSLSKPSNSPSSVRLDQLARGRSSAGLPPRGIPRPPVERRDPKPRPGSIPRRRAKAETRAPRYSRSGASSSTAGAGMEPRKQIEQHFGRREHRLIAWVDLLERGVGCSPRLARAADGSASRLEPVRPVRAERERPGRLPRAVPGGKANARRDSRRRALPLSISVRPPRRRLAPEELGRSRTPARCATSSRRRTPTPFLGRAAATGTRRARRARPRGAWPPTRRSRTFGDGERPNAERSGPVDLALAAQQPLGNEVEIERRRRHERGGGAGAGARHDPAAMRRPGPTAGGSGSGSIRTPAVAGRDRDEHARLVTSQGAEQLFGARAVVDGERRDQLEQGEEPDLLLALRPGSARIPGDRASRLVSQSDRRPRVAARRGTDGPRPRSAPTERPARLLPHVGRGESVAQLLDDERVLVDEHLRRLLEQPAPAARRRSGPTRRRRADRARSSKKLARELVLGSWRLEQVDEARQLDLAARRRRQSTATRRASQVPTRIASFRAAAPSKKPVRAALTSKYP